MELFNNFSFNSNLFSTGVYIFLISELFFVAFANQAYFSKKRHILLRFALPLFITLLFTIVYKYSYVSLLFYYFILLNVYSLAIFSLDKFLAMKHLKRISESFFFDLSLSGGCFAIIVGIFLLNHKRSKTSFNSKIYIHFAIFIILISVIFFSKYYNLLSILN